MTVVDDLVTMRDVSRPVDDRVEAAAYLMRWLALGGPMPPTECHASLCGVSYCRRCAEDRHRLVNEAMEVYSGR